MSEPVYQVAMRPVPIQIPPMSAKWVNEIHGRLAVRYGDAWVRKWGSLDVELVKADWARVCAGMTREEVAKALDSLPESFPPTASEFKKLGRIPPEHMTATFPPRINPKDVDKEGIRRIAQELRRITEKNMETNAARRRERITGTKQEFSRGMIFNAIDPELLPPEMRK